MMLSVWYMPEKNVSLKSTQASAGLVAVDRIIVGVHNIAEAEAIYTRMFGRAASWRRMNSVGGTQHVYFYFDNIGFELMSPCGPGIWGQHLAGLLKSHGEGIAALCLASDDAVATVAALNTKGLPTVILPESQAYDETGRTRYWRHALVTRQMSRDLALIITQTYTKRNEKKLAPLRDGVAETAAISGLDHIVVMTSDAEACKHLFGEQLGIRLALDHTKPEWGMRQLFFRLGGVTIEVVEQLDKAKAPETDYFWGTAWKTADINSIRARMIAEGADVSEVRKGRAKGTEVVSIRPPTSGIPTLLVSKKADEQL